MRVVIKRIWHEIRGHPWKEVTWGNLAEGAKCKCGFHFWLDDFYPKF